MGGEGGGLELVSRAPPQCTCIPVDSSIFRHDVCPVDHYIKVLGRGSVLADRGMSVIDIETGLVERQRPAN